MEPQIDEAYYTKLVENFVSQKRLLSSLETQINKMKKELSDLVDEHGLSDDSGHKWLNVGGHELKRERRVSKSLDVTAATEWAKANNVWNDVMEVVEILSEDKLLGKAWEDKTLMPVVQGFYVEKETWAFKA
jgi:prefoldin subunit 5